MKKFLIPFIAIIMLITMQITAMGADQGTVPATVPTTDQQGFVDTTNNITTISNNVVIKKNERLYGNITTVSGNVEVYGEVNGNITTATGNIVLKEGSKVRGNLTTALGKIDQNPRADVMGNITRANGIRVGSGNGVVFDRSYANSFPDRLFNSFAQMLGLFAVIVIILCIFPQNLQKMLKAFNIEPGRVVVVGILGWIFFVPVLVFSVITIVGPLIVGLAGVAAVLIGTTIVSYLLGEKILELFHKPNENKITTAVAGLLVLWLASFIPIAKVFIVLICSIIGMGVMLVTKFGTGRPWFPPRVTGTPTGTYRGLNPSDVPGQGGDKNEQPKN